MTIAKLWIEAEEWAPGQWEPTNDVTEVAVTLDDGSRWVATFCAFDHLATLRANCAAVNDRLIFPRVIV